MMCNVQTYRNFEFDHEIQLRFFPDRIIMKEDDGYESEYRPDEDQLLVEELIACGYDLVNEVHFEILIGGRDYEA